MTHLIIAESLIKLVRIATERYNLLITIGMQINTGDKQRVSTAEFAAKFRSKYEVYTFLSIDAMAFLPPPECVTIYFLKDLIRGKKKCKWSS